MCVAEHYAQSGIVCEYEGLTGVTTKVAVVCYWMPYDLIAVY